MDEMIAVTICEVYGWDWETYNRQPVWFIDLIKQKMDVDAKKQNIKKP